MCSFQSQDQASTRFQGSPGGQHVIHQQNMPACQLLRPCQAEGPRHVFPSFLPAPSCLRLRMAHSTQCPPIKGNTQAPCHCPPEDDALVEAPLPLAAPIQRYRHDTRNLSIVRAAGQTLPKPVPEVASHFQALRILQRMHQALDPPALHKREQGRTRVNGQAPPKSLGKAVFKQQMLPAWSKGYGTGQAKRRGRQRDPVPAGGTVSRINQKKKVVEPGTHRRTMAQGKRAFQDKQKTSAPLYGTDASKQNEKPTLNKSLCR